MIKSGDQLLTRLATSRSEVEPLPKSPITPNRIVSVLAPQAAQVERKSATTLQVFVRIFVFIGVGCVSAGTPLRELLVPKPARDCSSNFFHCATLGRVALDATSPSLFLRRPLKQAAGQPECAVE